MDYYSILGVAKTATSDEIKQAYRKLAKEHHPDRTGGDDTTFKQINEAYDTLKDPQRRQEYDNPQPRFDTNTMNNGNFNFEDIFSQFGFNVRARQNRNRDVKLATTITLEEVLTGKDILINYRLANGLETSASVQIHKGIMHGEVIRFKGLGDNMYSNLPRGDLLLLVKIEKHRRFDVDGIHLVTNQDISVLDLILGKKITVRTLQGNNIEVTIPKGTQPNTIMNVAGYGLPDFRSGKTGNLYVKLKGIVPKINDNKILERIKNLNDEISSGS